MEKKYWKSIEESQQPNKVATDGQQEEHSIVDILSDESKAGSSSRRDFLKWCGISFVSATVISACEIPVKKAIPYLNQPEELIAGKSSWYASSYVQGNEYCPVLIRSRDGRPIKVEGNKLSSITRGGTSARVQASVLSLYDNAARYKGPLHQGKENTWASVDEQILSSLSAIQSRQGRMVLVTPTLLSPSTRQLLIDSQQAFPGLEIITWDPISYSAIRQAHQISFGRPMVPDYRFEKASLIISFSADFLGTWISPVEFARNYAAGRKLGEQQKHMSRHIHFESSLSLTGCNADERLAVTPSQEKSILMGLYDALARATGNQILGAPQVSYDVDSLAALIGQNRGGCLVVCGHNNPELQVIVNGINQMAGSYGNTISTVQPLNIGMSQEDAFENLVMEMQRGEVDAIMFYKSNPLYSYPHPEMLSQGLEKTSLSISFATTRDETAAACQFILPDHHYLESWGDAEFKTGMFSLIQPLINPIFNTRQFQDTLLSWMDHEQTHDEYLKSYWEQNIYPGQDQQIDFAHFWRNSLQAGILENTPGAALTMTYTPGGGLSHAFDVLKQSLSEAGSIEYSLINSIALADGTDANNPWLQELPDPVSSVTWDNFAALSPRHASELGLAEGERIRINETLDIPVLLQPGQAYGCISVALGYGRTHAGITGDNTGSNAFSLVTWRDQSRQFSGTVQNWEKLPGKHVFARTQTHFSMEGRAIVRETTLEPYLEDPASGNEIRAYHKKHHVTLYPEHSYPGHHWLLMVDLNACTGCSSCVIACQSENNTPVIGKDEVRRRRIMHWMRIDRYYSGDAENPGVVFQPLMCQHCDHAPCENVCPVAATPHSSEGLNQMAYNRCVGTKYCINNCPYKVRRFNWYAYAEKSRFSKHSITELGRMVLNPDVTVRERGVVEKCSFCVQRLQDAKLTAKTQGRKLRDGEAEPACVSVCPSNALVFGDRNDPNSRVAQLLKDPRNYHLLEELHTLPSVGYLTKVKNPRG